MKTRKIDEHRKKMFSEHGHKSLAKYEHESLAEHKAEHDEKKHEAKMKKAMHHPDKLGAGAAKRKELPKKDKMRVVMKEFHRGTLNSSSGKKVTNPKMAAAIGYSEARREGAHLPKPKKHKK